jgi:hypothetical protein
MTGQAVKSEKKFVAVPGGRISYDVMGEGPAVLCLPSLGDTRRVRVKPGQTRSGVGLTRHMPPGRW